MVRKIIIAAASAAILTLSSTAFTQQPSQFGTAVNAGVKMHQFSGAKMHR
jgi:hypothetical protein